jgi:hypothetical protein
MKISAPYVEKKYQNINNKLSSVIMEHPLSQRSSNKDTMNKFDLFFKNS